MKDRIDIRTTSVKERNMILAAALEVGYRWHGVEGWTPAQIEGDFPWSAYPTIQLRVKSRYVGGSFDYVGGSFDIGSNASAAEGFRFLAEETPEEPTVRLNGVFLAERKGDKIVIGCQTFPVEKIAEVYEKLIRDYKSTPPIGVASNEFPCGFVDEIFAEHYL